MLNSLAGKNVVSEVKAIMGSSSQQLLYSTSSRSLVGQSSQIPRRPKRQSKLQFANSSIVKGTKRKRASTATFQKKLVVFRCMGENNAPKKFTRADKRICMRGLLQPINLDATEDEVRKEICDVIRSKSELTECTPGDFEFIDMCGKQASVPNCTPGFIFDARAIKQLAGSGSVYVRLTRDVCVSSCSSSDEDLPKFDFLHKTAEENLARKITASSDSRDSMCSQNLDALPPVSEASTSHSGLCPHGIGNNHPAGTAVMLGSSSTPMVSPTPLRVVKPKTKPIMQAMCFLFMCTTDACDMLLQFFKPTVNLPTPSQAQLSLK